MYKSVPLRKTSSTASHHTTTDNDEAIAQLLAREEQERIDSEIAHRMGGQTEMMHSGVGGGSTTSNYDLGSLVSGMMSRPPPGTRRGSGRPPAVASVVPGRGHPRSPAAGGGGRADDVSCPGRHGLNQFSVSDGQKVRCDMCHRTVLPNDSAYGCITCNYDICKNCKDRGGSGGGGRGATSRRNLGGGEAGHETNSAVATRSSTTRTSPNNPQFQSPGHAAGGMTVVRRPPQTNMCIAPCILGEGICVEMMVDTGAQTSVMSLSLARQLGLEHRIDQSERGVAAGVGRANIVGKIRNVPCELGHVEFLMDFAVLEVQDKILLLGLDLMRRYKCIVDLERDVLIFGGSGGVEVTMLPAEDQHVSLRNQLGGCPMM